jgi:hypothetical protein
MPLVRPVKVQPVEVPVSEVEQAAETVTAGDDVTVKPDKPEPPVAPGIAQEMAADPVEAVAPAATDVGGPGSPVVIEFDDADAGLFPLPLVAFTVKV